MLQMSADKSHTKRVLNIVLWSECLTLPFVVDYLHEYARASVAVTLNGRDMYQLLNVQHYGIMFEVVILYFTRKSFLN